MSVKIRLRRMGKKKQPHYRIVATDSRAPRDGRFVENLGYYHPIHHPAALSVDLERVDYWVGQGAIVSPTVRSLVSKARAGGDEKVALVGALADADAGAEAVAANGAAAESAGDAGDRAAPEPDETADDKAATAATDDAAADPTAASADPSAANAESAEDAAAAAETPDDAAAEAASDDGDARA